MNYHIVRMNETVDKIALTYNLSVSEIKNLNQHIRDWDQLIAGTKINLPAIPEVLKDELNDVEPFIEEYYPKIINKDSYFTNGENVTKTDVKKEEINPKHDESVVSSHPEVKQTTTMKAVNYPKSSIYYNGYYPPYSPYYPYYPPYNLRRKRPTK